MKNSRILKKVNIKVVNPKVESLTATLDNDIKYVGESAKINSEVQVDYDKFKEKQVVTYESSDENILKIEGNVVEAVGVGKASLYIKAGDKIADFLRLCNASNALFEFEDSRIQRDFYNQITRLDNCEVANEVKSLKAAKSQLEAIEFLERHAKNIVIPEKIMHAMQIRKMYPEANLNELCLECKNEFGEDISKSGMKHRLAKVKQMVSELKEELDA